ncbi:Hypothetical predicted protein [Lecanosticta acicola]|uniref:Apple domain-containing protein n=1 Tax=Lecanosticta acicola TaxID=111012 RepID=A0AAI9EFT1_9PEZI|nr:Hypothetical predicted protein [Lecanosticta acicola]
MNLLTTSLIALALALANPLIVLAQQETSSSSSFTDCGKSATLLAGTQPYVFAIHCGAHYLGDEITRFSTTTTSTTGAGLRACAEACANHQWVAKPCRSATLVEPTSTCILRSSVGEVAGSAYVDCAVLL